MTVDEKLVPARVPVSATPAGMTQKCVWKPIQRAQLGLEALSAHVDDDSLAACRDAVVWNGHVHGVVVGDDSRGGSRRPVSH